jgi:hypothetical protein
VVEESIKALLIRSISEHWRQRKTANFPLISVEFFYWFRTELQRDLNKI